MSALYKGESKYRTFILKDSEGTPIDHANIEDIEVVLLVDEVQVAKFKKVPTTGYTDLMEESDAGAYSFKLTEAMTLAFPTSKSGLIMELWRKYPDANLPVEGYKRIKQVTLYDEVRESQYQMNR